MSLKDLLTELNLFESNEIEKAIHHLDIQNKNIESTRQDKIMKNYSKLIDALVSNQKLNLELIETLDQLKNTRKKLEKLEAFKEELNVIKLANNQLNLVKLYNHLMFLKHSNSQQ